MDYEITAKELDKLPLKFPMNLGLYGGVKQMAKY